ncbi:MAG: SDR family NAD(P)-dependent oxidoreductase [Myxococcota bacterium]
MEKKKAVVIGASSGIGRALAKILAREGFFLGLVGRNEEALNSLKEEIGEQGYVKIIDVSDPDKAISLFKELIAEIGGLDLAVISSGIGFYNKKLLWEREFETFKVNILGFSAMANVAFNHFRESGGGHLVGISSVAAVRGDATAPAYSASKAFESNYLEGLSMQARKQKLNITVTDIRPGFVDTPMTKGQRGMFWVAPVEKAALQIYRAIKRKKSVAYITRRWLIVAWLLKILPKRSF